MIRKLIKDDWARIKKILIDTKHFNDEEIKIALELIDIYLNDKEQRDYNIFVYEERSQTEFGNEGGRGDGVVAGYICFGKRPLTEGTYDLYWIAVDPNTHGKGIGSQLVRFMEDELKKIPDANLVLIETSGQAGYEGERKFYEKNGYEVQTIIKDFYRRDDDLVVYYKYL
jgi:ribosomal protein S18 acetylase RimI-like enzyme